MDATSATPVDDRDLIEQRAREARRELAQAFRAFGLRALPHFSRDFAEDSIWVECRVQTAQHDHELVYRVMDAKGWKPNSERLSRYSQAFDVVRLRHARTKAVVTVIVKHPFGQVQGWEAA